MTLDVAALERATYAAVPPRQLLELPGWLVGLDDGTVGRAHSAVPLRHDATAVNGIDAVLEAFASAGREPVVRVPSTASLEAVRARLEAAGLRAGKPTLVMSGSSAGLASLASHWPLELSREPGDD
ncbi:MAG: GNAT family N-acetyltransferase, partial [Comamonadaceae bacterium]